MIDFENAKKYVLSILCRKMQDDIVSYGSVDYIDKKRIHIVESSFWNSETYGTLQSFPQEPFSELVGFKGVPVLFGTSDVEKKDNGDIVIHADLVAGAFFMLSRYEEIVNKKRDEFSRFRAEYSVIFRNGYGSVPIVDAYSEYLVRISEEISDSKSVKNNSSGFSKIYLTHDVDQPFRYYRIDSVFKQWVKNFLHIGVHMEHCLRTFVTQKNDPYDTFDEIIKIDGGLRNKVGKDIVECIYFIITAKAHLWNQYCPVNTKRFGDLLKRIKESGATVGLHVGLEAGKDSKKIEREVLLLPDVVDRNRLKSRNHFLRWAEPEQITDMEKFGIKEDFTLGYADCVGFRVGTCFPYKFINPFTGDVTGVVIHPLEIMDTTLDGYMYLDKNEALLKCKEIIDQVYHYGGELDLLWHNTSFFMQNYRKDLYIELLDYIWGLYGHN